MSSTNSASIIKSLVERVPLSGAAYRHALVASVVLGAALVLQPSGSASAQVAAAPCAGSTTQSGVFGGGAQGVCLTQGQARVGRVPAGNYQIVHDFVDQPCTNPDGLPSHKALEYQINPDGTRRLVDTGPAAGDPLGDGLACLQYNGTAPGLDANAKAVEFVPKPQISSDFTKQFLTQAPATFSLNPDGNANTGDTVMKTIPGFDAVLVFTVKTYKWDFGDGTTATDAHPVKTWTTKSPNPANPNDHNVHVRVTVTWTAQLRQQIAGNLNVQAIGDVVANGALDQPIVEVWSAQTEPMSN